MLRANKVKILLCLTFPFLALFWLFHNEICIGVHTHIIEDYHSQKYEDSFKSYKFIKLKFLNFSQVWCNLKYEYDPLILLLLSYMY